MATTSLKDGAESDFHYCSLGEQFWKVKKKKDSNATTPNNQRLLEAQRRSTTEPKKIKQQKHKNT